MGWPEDTWSLPSGVGDETLFLQDMYFTVDKDEEIMKGLGQAQLSQLASKAGISPQDLSSTLARVLPDIVDKLTPQGSVPTDDMLQQGLKALRGNLKF